MRLFFTLGMLALVGCGKTTSTPEAAVERRFPVTTVTVTEQDLTPVVIAPGSLLPDEVVRVPALVGGTVTRVLVREGDTVVAGEVLAELDDERARLGLVVALAERDRAQAVSDEAAAGESRRARLAKDGAAISDEEVAVSVARAAQARASLARAAADLALAELDLRRHHVVSPVAGLVETREVVTGQELPPGAAVATVVRRDPMRVRFQVVESEAALLMPGQVVTFRVDGASATHAATIAQVAQAADPHTRQVSVQALVAGPTDGLRGNAFVRVECRPGTMRRAVVVPAAAVRPGERGFIAYVVAEGKAQERILTLGVHGDGGMEVRAGLAAGEELVMRGADSLRDGTLVRSATGSTP